MPNITATAEIAIDATPERVWLALTEPSLVKKYFMDADVATDWRPGSPITWTGEYQGTSYQDKGTVVAAEPPRRLQHTHFSPMSGQPDEPGSYHTLTYTLTVVDGRTTVVMTQDNNGSPDEATRATETWRAMLDGLKKTAEEL